MSNFTFHTIESSTGDAKKILEQVQGGYGFVPNLFAYMAEAPTTLEAYLHLNALLEKTSFTPAQLQTALLAISIENDCNFCASAHHAIGKAKGIKPQTLEALLKNADIDDASDKALVTLARTMVQKRGWLEDADLKAFFAAGFNQQQVFEVVLINTIKTLSNYSNHLTQPEVNPELQAMINQ